MVKAPQVAAIAEAEESTAAEKGTLVKVQSPLTGVVKPLSEAADPVFAQGVMGQGVLIELSEGLLAAPVDGVVSVLFPSNHAVGLVTDQGLELLMHIGMDTVNLEGKGFKAFVKQGDRVKTGDKLISFDIDVIKKRVMSLKHRLSLPTKMIISRMLSEHCRMIPVREKNC